MVISLSSYPGIAKPSIFNITRTKRSSIFVQWMIPFLL